MRLLLQRLARSGGSQLAALADAAAALQPEARPTAAAAAAAWHPQRRFAAAAGDGGEAQPPAAEPAAPPAAAKEAAAPAAMQPATKPAKQQQGTQQGAKQQQGAKAKAGSGKPQGKPAAQQQKKKQQAPKSAGAGAGASPGAPRSRLSGKPVAALLDAAPGFYVEVPAGVLPEAEAEYYQDPVLKGENVHEPNYGCKAVQREWEWSGRRSLMARGCMQSLARTVQEGGKRRIYLDGRTGSGKSVALYSLVAWAREQGWVALYIPSAFSLIQNGTFAAGEDGLWDTPEAARWILSSLRDSHAAQLPDIKTPAGQTLADLVEAGLAPAAKPAEAVAAAIAAKDALQACHDVRTLIAVDDYNVLYSHTGYYESMHNFHRRQLAPDELRLARAFRLLEQQPPAGGGAVVAAPTFGQTVSRALRVPAPAGARFEVPRLGLEEVAAAAEYFVGEVMGGQPAPDQATLRRALFLTAGNAGELRDAAPGLYGEQDPLGLSLGYKAAAAERRAADLSAI